VPTKAAYKAFENDQEVLFEFFLATKLHMTVDELRCRMSNHEFLKWNIYYRRLEQERELQVGKAAG
jgi:hypothetical protein